MADEEPFWKRTLRDIGADDTFRSPSSGEEVKERNQAYNPLDSDVRLFQTSESDDLGREDPLQSFDKTETRLESQPQEELPSMIPPAEEEQKLPKDDFNEERPRERKNKNSIEDEESESNRPNLMPDDQKEEMLKPSESSELEVLSNEQDRQYNPNPNELSRVTEEHEHEHDYSSHRPDFDSEKPAVPSEKPSSKHMSRGRDHSEENKDDEVDPPEPSKYEDAYKEFEQERENAYSSNHDTQSHHTDDDLKYIIDIDQPEVHEERERRLGDQPAHNPNHSHEHSRSEVFSHPEEEQHFRHDGQDVPEGEDFHDEAEDHIGDFGGGQVDGEHYTHARPREFRPADASNEDDVESHESFGRNDPVKHIRVTNNDQDILDFKASFTHKFEEFKRIIVEKYQNYRMKYLQQFDFKIVQNERENASAIDYMEQQIQEAIEDKDNARKRATESRIIFANVMRIHFHTKRLIFNAWKYYYEWKKYQVAKGKFCDNFYKNKCQRKVLNAWRMSTREAFLEKAVKVREQYDVQQSSKIENLLLYLSQLQAKIKEETGLLLEIPEEYQYAIDNGLYRIKEETDILRQTEIMQEVMMTKQDPMFSIS